MKPDIFTSHIAQHDLCEYSLAARPDNDVTDKVIGEMQNFYEEHREKLILEKEPGITVASFIANECMEETIIRWMQRVCCNQQSFTVTLNNYGGFPSHTIYLRVQNADPFHQLVKQLNVIDTYVISCLCPPVKFSTNPHLRIVKNLPEELYYQALSWCAQRCFRQSFVVKELFLLRRKHHFDQCKAVNVFGLQPAKIELPLTY